jgi:trehalose synthase-fused probable maltokinase
MANASDQVSAALAAAGAPAVSEAHLGEWMRRQRWFAGKSRDIGQVAILDAVPISDGAEPLLLLIVEVRAAAGTHSLYQLLAGVSHDGDAGGREHAEICSQDGTTIYDALTDEQQTASLGQLIAADASIEHGPTTVAFRRSTTLALAPSPQVRVLDAEQSNSSVVLDEAHIVKAFRRVEPGMNPEIEMLHFLDRHGFANLAPIEGHYDYRGELLEASLGIMQRFVPEGRDGWELALGHLQDATGDSLIASLRDLGTVTGSMHTVLASDLDDSEFAPERPADEQVALLTATIDEQIERLFIDLPERPELEPIARRGEELRDRLSMLSHTGIGGRLIRIHGDFHLGQTLLTPSGWILIDFEGEPGRPLRERRRKRSPLRDVAGMLRSISYSTLAAEVLHGADVPRDWERRARDSFLEGYMEKIDTALLPAGAQAIAKQLAMFELEKVIYELRYELENRPDWVPAPVAGMVRLLDEAL